MAGDYTSTSHDVSTADDVVDRLIFSDGYALSVMHLSRVIGCKDSHLLCALRSLVSDRTITTSGSSRKHPGLPAMVTLSRPPSFGRALDASRRLRKAPPKRPKRMRKPAKVITPIEVPPPMADQTEPAAVLFRNILDGCSRRERENLPVRMLLFLEGGRPVTISASVKALGFSRGHVSRMMTKLRKVGVVTEPTEGAAPVYRLTHLGRAVVARARLYHEAWCCPLSPSATETLRIIARIGSATSTDIARERKRSRNTANTALLNLQKSGLAEVIGGSGRGVSMLVYALTEKGRSILVCI